MIAPKKARGILAAACLCSVVAGYAHSAEPPAGGDVTVETVPQRTVVFVDHVGPYWGIAKELQTVRSYMHAHHLSGPLLIRYAADPTRARGASIAMEIGFASDGKHEPTAPFKKETWGAEFVATTRVPAGSAGLAIACRRIRAWSKSRNFVPTGPVIEIFVESAAGAADQIRSTVQMQIRPVEPVPSETDDDGSEPQASPDKPTKQTGAPTQAAPTKPTALANETPVDGRHVRLLPDPPNVDQTTRTDRQPSSLNAQSAGAATKPDTHTPIPTIRPVPGIRDTPKSSGDHDTKEAEPKRLKEKEPQETETKSLARRLVPPPSSLDDRSRVWLGQVVLRLRAISRGTKRLYHDEGAGIIGLADAVVDRYARLYGQSNPSAPSAPQATDPADSALSQQRKAVTRDLDRFMAVLGSKSLSISETEIQFRRIIIQAAETADVIVLRKQ